jgi:hypothetical protein
MPYRPCIGRVIGGKRDPKTNRTSKAKFHNREAAFSPWVTYSRRISETIFPKPRSNPETDSGLWLLSDERWGSVMWAILEDLYREYCLSRLQEMRRYELSH